jgi:hypothetical protein
MYAYNKTSLAPLILMPWQVKLTFYGLMHKNVCFYCECDTLFLGYIWVVQMKPVHELIWVKN